MSTIVSGDIKLSNEHTEYRWVDLKEAAALDLIPEAKDAVDYMLSNPTTQPQPANAGHNFIKTHKYVFISTKIIYNEGVNMKKQNVTETLKKEDPLFALRHSAEHVMHMAIEQIFQGAKKVMGPPIENGFLW